MIDFALNADINQRRNIKRFSTSDVLDGDIVIVGGGPSLVELTDEIRARKQNGAQIWATNNTYVYLINHGIQPDAHIVLDAKPENVEFIYPHKDVTYYLNVSCDPSLFDKLSGHNVIMYDLSSAPTGKTVGIKALYLAAFSGYRNFYLYGFDSSCRDGKHHAYSQIDDDIVVDVTVANKEFKCTQWMIDQAEDFEEIAKSFAEQNCVITVAGNGLLPWIANRLVHVPKILTAVWDLQLCPPTYDAASFINEAENRRIKINAEAIDFIIQPGPVGGFRDDDLPPNLGARIGMLYRVVVGMMRLLPSVRNIEILKERKVIVGKHIFPDKYDVNNPVSQYGQHYAQFAKPIFKASETAKLHVSKVYPDKYCTITMRDASHWPSRNSNSVAWYSVSKWLNERGYKVVWIPDAESVDANLYSFDFDMRLALYENAVVNLGINNGPTAVLPYASAKYIIFKMVTDGIPWTTREFHEKWGTKEGDHIPGIGKYVFEADDYERIVQELELFFEKQTSAMAA